MKKIITFLITDLHRKEENGKTIDGVFERIVELCKANNITNIINAGDNFHSRKGQLQNILVGFERNLDSLEEAGIIMHCIPGNHDKTDYGLEESFLNPYKHHPALNLIKNPAGVLLNDIMFHFIPFFDEKVLYVERLNSYIESVPKLLKQYKGRNILITHVGINGAKTNDNHVHDSPIVYKDLFKHFDKTLVGHFHNKTDLGKNIHYVGSTIQHNYGETTDKGIVCIYDDLTFDYVEVDFPKFIVVEYNVDDVKNKKKIADLVKKIENGDRVRIILSGEEKEIKSLDLNYIKLLGIDIKTKSEVEISDDGEQHLELIEFDNKKILEEFKVFCEKENIDIETGIEFLKQINIQ